MSDFSKPVRKQRIQQGARLHTCRVPHALRQQSVGMMTFSFRIGSWWRSADAARWPSAERKGNFYLSYPALALD